MRLSPNGDSQRGERAPLAPAIRAAFKGTLVLNSDYTFERAQKTLANGTGDAISFGRPFIANPGVPHRLTEGLPLAKDDMATWYSQGLEGYLEHTAR